MSGLSCAIAHNVRGRGTSHGRLTSHARFREGSSRASSLSISTSGNIGCSLLKRVTRTTAVAHHYTTHVLGDVQPSQFLVFESGPRRFVTEINHLVIRRGTGVIISRVYCSQVRNKCSSDVFAGNNGGHSRTRNCRTSGYIRS